METQNANISEMYALCSAVIGNHKVIHDGGTMLKGLRVTGMLAVAALLVLSSVSTVFAGGSDGVYGLIFIDSNLNGVLDQGESGYAGVKTESVVYGET
jgi:hypothetical protein